MRRGFSIAICLAGLLAAGAGAAIIDRIAVSVGSRVITETDLDREIRITALLNNAKPDFSPANKRTTAERMVDQALIRSELETSRYPMPSGGKPPRRSRRRRPAGEAMPPTAAHWPITA